MGIPAIPSYLNNHLAGDQAPPGHRFCLYFPVWQPDWTIDRNGKKNALQQVLAMGRPAAEMLRHIRDRQNATADALGHDMACRFEAVSTAPFVTGVGMEHPVENGFAFLSPYGLPYLAGSGVKGVLRKAAEELALMPDEIDRKGWDMLALWLLFGFEAAAACLGVTAGLPRGVNILTQITETRTEAYRAAAARLDPEEVHRFMEAVITAEQRRPFRDDPRAFLLALIDDRKLRESISFRGALSFWDVFPAPFDNSLAVDILNPHHGKYYQDGSPPADCESPLPNFFLVLPPKSRFDFYVQCEKDRLPQDLSDRWKSLLKAAFSHAFDWLGFGAKTAVGYGQMQQVNTNPANQTAPGAANPATNPAQGGGSCPATPPPDPKQVRQDKLAAFRNALPKLQDLPGRMQTEIDKVRNEQDTALRRELCRALLDLARSDKKKFKEAIKKEKQWATSIVKLSEDLGLERP